MFDTMCKLTFAFAAATLLGTSASHPARAQGERQGGNKLEGTCWKLVSMKYGDAKDFSPQLEGSVSRRVFSKTNLIWVDYDEKTGVLRASAGATYKLEGDTLKLKPTFASENMKHVLTKEGETFSIKIERNRLRLSGTFSWGVKMEEVWEKIE